MNREGYTGVLPTGRNALGQNICVGYGLIRSENRVDLSFMVSTALPILLGRALDRCCVILSDGNQQICDAIDSAIALGTLGAGDAIRRLCTYHLEVQPYMNNVLPLALGPDSSTCPLRRAHAIFHYTKARAVGDQEVGDGMMAMRRCVDEAMAKLSAAGADKVEKWYVAIDSHRQQVFPGLNPGVMTGWESVSSPVESEHAQAKGKAHNSAGLSKMNRQHSTLQGSIGEDRRQEARQVRRCRATEIELSKAVQGVPEDVSTQLLSIAAEHFLRVTKTARHSICRVSETQLVCHPLHAEVVPPGFPEFRREVTLQLSPDLRTVSCLGARGKQDGLPCQHIVDFNLGTFAATDVIMPLHVTVHAGLLDELIHFSGRESLTLAAAVMVDVNALYPLQASADGTAPPLVSGCDSIDVADDDAPPGLATPRLNVDNTDKAELHSLWYRIKDYSDTEHA